MSGVATLDHTGFVTEDLVRAEKFYKDLFGAEVLFRAHLSTADRKAGSVPLTFVNMGGHRYELFLTLDEFLPPNEVVRNVPRIAFEVSDHELDRAVDVLQSKGISFEGPVDSSSYATLGRSLCLLDPDHNSVELCTRRTDGAAVPARADDGPIQVGRIGHVLMEVPDLDATEYFYGAGLGLTSLGRDQGETGRDRLALRAASGQLISFEQVDALSGRSLFRCGEDRAPVPDAVPGTPYRYKGAHLAVSVESLEDFERVQRNIPEFGGFDEGDRAGIRRPAGKPSTYFFDPAGNRLQLIIL